VYGTVFPRVFPVSVSFCSQIRAPEFARRSAATTSFPYRQAQRRMVVLMPWVGLVSGAVVRALAFKTFRYPECRRRHRRSANGDIPAAVNPTDSAKPDLERRSGAARGVRGVHTLDAFLEDRLAVDVLGDDPRNVLLRPR